MGTVPCALLLVVGMKLLAGNVAPPKVGGEPEVIRPRPLVVRTSPKKPDPMALPRILIGARDTAPVIESRIAGWHEWLRRTNN